MNFVSSQNLITDSSITKMENNFSIIFLLLPFYISKKNDYNHLKFVSFLL